MPLHSRSTTACRYTSSTKPRAGSVRRMGRTSPRCALCFSVARRLSRSGFLSWSRQSANESLVRPRRFRPGITQGTLTIPEEARLGLFSASDHARPGFLVELCANGTRTRGWGPASQAALRHSAKPHPMRWPAGTAFRIPCGVKRTPRLITTRRYGSGVSLAS